MPQQQDIQADVIIVGSGAVGVAAEQVVPFDLDWREALMSQLYPTNPAATVK